VSFVSTDNDRFIALLEQYTQIIELLTGIKKSLTDRGWSDHHAEIIVYVLFFDPRGTNRYK